MILFYILILRYVKRKQSIIMSSVQPVLGQLNEIKDSSIYIRITYLTLHLTVNAKLHVILVRNETQNQMNPRLKR